MVVLRNPEQYTGAGPSVVTVGNFDGVHRGHQLLIDQLKQRAERGKLNSVVLTFIPHTSAVLAPESNHRVLTTFEEKAVIFEQLGVDYLVGVQFDRSFAEISHDKFVKNILSDRLEAMEWVLGSNHKFGKERAGRVELLHGEGGINHIRSFVVDLHTDDSDVVSSTRIRSYVAKGRLESAVKALGHPYLILSRRTSGVRKGTELGFPTVNFSGSAPEKAIPPAGVYAAVLQSGEHSWRGALYSGDCPTFGNRTSHYEFHAFDTEGGDPGELDEGRIWVHNYVREDRAFPSPDRLVEAIKQDIRAIKSIFSME